MMKIKKSMMLLAFLTLSFTATLKADLIIPANDPPPPPTTKEIVRSLGERNIFQRGKASYYADQFHGRKTASGKTFNMHAMTMAHRTLPFGSKVRVTCTSTGKSVIVTVNDRGPVPRDRIADLSYGAAKSLGFVSKGITEIKLERLN